MEVRAGEAPSLVGKTLTTYFYRWDFTFVFREDGQVTVTGGYQPEGEVTEARYEQDGGRVRIDMGDWEVRGFYDGENLMLGSGVGGVVTYVVNSDF
jgi:hypothetical protein